MKRKTKKDLFASGYVHFSVYKAAEGGPGYSVMGLLKDAGIPCLKESSIYVGHVGIAVPKKFERKTSRILYC